MQIEPFNPDLAFARFALGPLAELTRSQQASATQPVAPSAPNETLRPAQPNAMPGRADRNRNPDAVELSNTARRAFATSQRSEGPGQATASSAEAASNARATEDATSPRSSTGEPLTEEQVREVEKLEARDREVRIHEEAHKAAAGALYRGGPYYEYAQGPDGNRYAVGGSVSIDTSPGRTPEETIAKAQQIRAAALAPAEPSSTDQRVAAKATQMEAQARAELNASNTDPESSEQAIAGATASLQSRQSGLTGGIVDYIA